MEYKAVLQNTNSCDPIKLMGTNKHLEFPEGLKDQIPETLVGIILH